MFMKKIVLIRRNGLGDFIAGMIPLCNYLQKIYDKCEFFFFMSEANSALVKYFFPNAHVIVIPNGNKYIQTLTTALKFRHIKPDIGISAMPDYVKLNTLFLFAIGAKDNYGRITNKIFSKVINHPYICSDVNDLFKYHVGLASLKFFDCNINEISKDIYPKFNKKLITPYKPESEAPYIMVEISNNRPTSQLSNNKIAEIFNYLYKQHSFSVLITAKHADREKADALKSILNMGAEVYITQNIHDFISFVNAADIVLCGDGGIGHMSGALDKKTVALYGQTSVVHWGILADQVTHLYDSEDVNNIPDKDIIDAVAAYL